MNIKNISCDQTYYGPEVSFEYEITFENIPECVFNFKLDLDHSQLYEALYLYENYKTIPENLSLLPYIRSLPGCFKLALTRNNELYWHASGLKLKGNSLDLMVKTVLEDIKKYKKSCEIGKMLITKDYDITFCQNKLIMKGCEIEGVAAVDIEIIKDLYKNKDKLFYSNHNIVRVENVLRIMGYSGEGRPTVFKFTPDMLDKFYSIAESLI